MNASNAAVVNDYAEAEQTINHHFNDVAYMSQLRDHMVKFAATQLPDKAIAEDLVQDALLGAVKNLQHFSGRAAFRSWVFAILKNKMVDFFRRQGRAPKTESLDFEDNFQENGHWQDQATPQVWQCPENGLKQQQFMQVLELCLNKLPARQARVFMMREFLGLSTLEICGQVGITQTNLNAMLCRARTALQQCLSTHWLDAASPKATGFGRFFKRGSK